MGFRLQTQLALVAVAVVTCGLVVLGAEFARNGDTSVRDEGATRAAAAVTTQFLTALDRGQYARACDLLAPEFYRRHRLPDRGHCIRGFTLGLGGTAVKFRIVEVEAQGGEALVRAVVDGAPGTIRLVRGTAGFRVLELRGA